MVAPVSNPSTGEVEGWDPVTSADREGQEMGVVTYASTQKTKAGKPQAHACTHTHTHWRKKYVLAKHRVSNGHIELNHKTNHPNHRTGQTAPRAPKQHSYGFSGNFTPRTPITLPSQPFHSVPPPL